MATPTNEDSVSHGDKADAEAVAEAETGEVAEAASNTGSADADAEPMVEG